MKCFEKRIVYRPKVQTNDSQEYKTYMEDFRKIRSRLGFILTEILSDIPQIGQKQVLQNVWHLKENDIHYFNISWTILEQAALYKDGTYIKKTNEMQYSPLRKTLHCVPE